MSFKEKKVLFLDHGLFDFLAVRLAEDFGKTLYFTEWEDGFPLPAKNHIGFGLSGVTRVDSFFEALTKEKPDLIVFPDVGHGALQEHLRSLGYRVFGSGKSEVLEDDRAFLREITKKVGLPVAPYKVVNGGIDELRKELQGAKDKYVKVSLYRGIGETFHHKNYKQSQPEINRHAHLLGVLDGQVEYLIEDPIPSEVELGVEAFVTDDGYLPKVMYGLEVKNKGYVGKVVNYADVPEPLKIVTDKFLPIFKKYKVRGAISTEVRITKDGKSYFIDPCQRFGSPPGEVLTEAYENLAEIMWNVADGKSVMPKPKATYWAEVMLQSRQAAREPIPIDIDSKFEKNIKLRYLCKIKGQYYYLPQGEETILGAAIGWGNTRKAAEDMAMEAASHVEAGDLYWDKDCFEQAEKSLEAAKAVGVKDF